MSRVQDQHNNKLKLFFHVLPSLRVNLDMGKSAYGWMIMKDENIPGTVVRTSTIPEELGRLVYLLTDKTGAAKDVLFAQSRVINVCRAAHV